MNETRCDKVGGIRDSERAGDFNRKSRGIGLQVLIEVIKIQQSLRYERIETSGNFLKT